MKCLCCERPEPEYSFDVVEVHTLHVRDFGGEKLVQALGEKKRYEVCTACAQSELRAVLFPAGRMLRGSLAFGVLLAVGAVMTATLSFSAEMMALRAIGPLSMFVGVSGIVGKVRELRAQRRMLAGLGREEAERVSAWRCVLRAAPKKYNDNDITYIPVDEISRLSAEELSAKYELLPAIVRKAKEQER